MKMLIRTLFLMCCTAGTLLAANIGDVLQGGSFWTMPKQEMINKYLVGLRYRNAGEKIMRIDASGSLTIGELKPREIDWMWDEKKEHPESLLVILYNKGDDGPIDKKEFNTRVTDAQEALNTLTGVAGRKKAVSTSESGVKLKAWVWEWENGAAMMEAHDHGKKKDYEAEFIRLRFAPDMAGLERGGAADAGNRRSLKEKVQRTPEGDVWIDGIPMVDQGSKGYCLPATVARVFAHYGMDGVDMHALASLCDTEAGGGTTLSGMLSALETIGRRFHVKAVPIVDKSKRPTTEEIVEAYNKMARRKGKAELPGFSGVVDRDMDAAVDRFDMEILEASFPVKKAAMKKWFRDIYKNIDAGVPVLWAIPGHMRMIMGYNEQDGVIYYSDTWGAGHEKKKMTNLKAYMITQYRGILRLSK